MSQPKSSAEYLREATAQLEHVSKEVRADYQKVESRMHDLEQHVATMGSYAGAGGRGFAGPSVASSFTASDSFAAMQKGANSTGRVEIQAPMNAITNTGEGGTEHDVQADRASTIYNDPRRSLTLLNLMPTLPVTSKTFEYLRLNGYQNAAAFQINEGDQKAEGDMPTELVDTPITTIAHFVRASAQIIDDAPALEQQINSLLRYGLMAKLENALINGTGTIGTIDGLLNQATAYTATADATADKIG
ncbi:phage capsid family protein [Salinisphaera sp. T31B1]